MKVDYLNLAGGGGLKLVALGGGHGLAATLQALRHVTHNLTAVVTVADDGGSSGRLREEFDVLPPGDLRMALAALCDTTEWGLTWRDVLQYRFQSEGPLAGHALGNLLITGLWDILGDPIAGLDWVAKLLGAHGRVLPMAIDPLEIEADVNISGRKETIRGQANVALTRGVIEHVRLVPSRPRVAEQVTTAVAEADWVVFGPGSWYTSVLPHLLVEDLVQALLKTSAKRAIVLNLAPQMRETAGLSVAGHLRVFHEHAPQMNIDVVIADPSAVDDLDELERTAEVLGAKLLLRQVRLGDGTPRHDPLRLAAAFRDAFEGFIGDVEPILEA